MKNLLEFKDFRELKKIYESTTTHVRTRFAPSPTGALHIGGVRTALFNYLFSKKHGGEFILRIEDTDRTRFVPNAQQYIIDSLEWLGIEFDEGPHVGGQYGPYIQTHRLDIYNKYLKILQDTGKCYYAFDTPGEIEIIRNKLGSEFSYGYKTRKLFKNQFTLSQDEVNKRIQDGEKYVIRALIPENKDISFNDLIRGNVTINTSSVDDKVLFKSDGIPTYHFANIVDDHTMKISHVIRGEEWLSSTPLHVILYDSFGWTPPIFAHLSLILGESGKLSKRDGDKYGFPVFPLDWQDPVNKDKITKGYKGYGYLPEAVINILAFLGWNPGTEKEIYTMNELIQDFDLKKVNKAGAKFNVDKARWYNSQHIKNLPIDKAIVMLKEILNEKGLDYSDDIIKKMVEFNKDRVSFISEIPEVSEYLFKKPKIYDDKVIRKKWNDSSPVIIDELKQEFDKVINWTATELQNVFEGFVNDKGYSFGNVMPILRLLITGMGHGPSLFDILEIIGKQETISRLTSYYIKIN
jgi:glutamyl-tRNA synthetase